MTSPAMSVRSDSRQNDRCPGVWPGVSSTVKPPTSSPSRRRRATGQAGPLQARAKGSLREAVAAVVRVSRLDGVGVGVAAPERHAEGQTKVVATADMVRVGVRQGDGGDRSPAKLAQDPLCSVPSAAVE